MKIKRLGRTGLNVSALCLGTMQFGWSADSATSHKIMSTAVENGCNFFDTANIYSRWVDGHEGGESENVIGRWLSSSSVRRDQIVIASKVRGRMGDGANDEGLSRTHIIREVENSLRRLQTDHIDLYQTHWPDEETPLDETLHALDTLVRDGKVRYVGCSNTPAWLLMKSLWVSDVKNLVRYDTVQPHYNLMNRPDFEREMQPLCLDQQIGVLVYSPLARGFLTGKYRPDTPLPSSTRAERVKNSHMNEHGWAVLAALDEVAAAHDTTLAQISIAWVMDNPAVTSTIIGANSVAQLVDVLGSGNVVLTEAEIERLNSASSAAMR